MNFANVYYKKLEQCYILERPNISKYFPARKNRIFRHLFKNMHAQLYLRKYENSIFALQSIEYNIESCSHEREGTEERKTKLSEYQYTTS